MLILIVTLSKEDKTCNQNVQMRIIDSETLSDNWYLLKNIPLTCKDAMANGSGKRVKFMTGERRYDPALQP